MSKTKNANTVWVQQAGLNKSASNIPKHQSSKCTTKNYTASLFPIWSSEITTSITSFASNPIQISLDSCYDPAYVEKLTETFIAHENTKQMKVVVEELKLRPRTNYWLGFYTNHFKGWRPYTTIAPDKPNLFPTIHIKSDLSLKSFIWEIICVFQIYWLVTF